MRTGVSVVCLVVALLFGEALPMASAHADAAVSVEQRSEGACSPPIVNNSGQVTIECPGIDEKALRYLEGQLTEQFRTLSAQLHDLDDSTRTIRNLNDLTETLRKQAEDWEQRYRELSARLASGPDESEQARQAHALIQQGEFDGAEAILQELAAKQEPGVARAAATQYDLGDLAMLRFDPAGALPHYDKAFRYEPDNVRYANGYATAAYDERHYADAERGWTTALQGERDLAARDPGAYTPDVAATLNNLGILYRDTGRLADAEKAYAEALSIRRDLAARDPGAYTPDVAATLNNLGILYSDTGRLADAEKAYAEALSIRRDLAARDPGAYRPAVATTLNNLGILYSDTGRLADAEKAYAEALSIRRDLAARDPGAYTPDVAATLNNLGILYRDTGRLADAEKAYAEALSIRRDLAVENPNVYTNLVESLTRRITELSAPPTATNH